MHITEQGKTVGKTFSLFGPSNSSKQYFHDVRCITDELLRMDPNTERVLDMVQKASKRRRYLQGLLNHTCDGTLISVAVNRSLTVLSDYTKNVHSHLAELPLSARLRDRTLATSEQQYHLYMLEIELTNRLYREKFYRSTTRMAFLPHCLHDLSAECQASERDGVDYVCKGCSKHCQVNALSKLLRRHLIKPYIWMSADLTKLFRTLKSTSSNNLGVLGVACIPELVHGMRLCRRIGVPVVGVPLNANRCRRWTGTWNETSVNLDMIESVCGAPTP